MNMKDMLELDKSNVEKLKFEAIKRKALEVLGDMHYAISTNDYKKMISLLAVNNESDRCFIDFGDKDYPVDIGDVVDVLKNYIIKQEQENK